MRSLPVVGFSVLEKTGSVMKAQAEPWKLTKTSKMLLHVECVRVITVWDMVRTPYTSQVLLLYVKPHKVG